MDKLSDLQPTEYSRLMDLVAAAGIDVADWANFGGSPAANPKYCYEWVFEKPHDRIALTLWHDKMEEENGKIFIRNNPRKFGQLRGGIEKSRGTKADVAIQMAVRENLPVRVIILGGERRGDNDFQASASKVKFRKLDPVEWHVTEYDWDTGDSVLNRGALQFVDQFSILETPDDMPRRREVSGFVFDRKPVVRTNVLRRANGKCELCGQLGFSTENGGIYLETHHVIPLSEGGSDNVSNVAAVCPNHHREAHHGENRSEIKRELLERLATLYPSPESRP